MLDKMSSSLVLSLMSKPIKSSKLSNFLWAVSAFFLASSSAFGLLCLLCFSASLLPLPSWPPLPSLCSSASLLLLPSVCFTLFVFNYSFEEFPRNLRTCRRMLIRSCILIESYNCKNILYKR